MSLHRNERKERGLLAGSGRVHRAHNAHCACVCKCNQNWGLGAQRSYCVVRDPAAVEAWERTYYIKLTPANIIINSFQVHMIPSMTAI